MFMEVKKIFEMGFDAYCFRIYPELSKAYELTTEKVPDEKMVINDRLEELSIHYPRIREILAVLDAFLDVEEYNKKPERCEGKTDLDRSLEAKFNVAEERCIRDRVEGLAKSMETRISVLQSRFKDIREHEEKYAK